VGHLAGTDWLGLFSGRPSKVARWAF
jgi:hypothetical protein